MKRMVAPGRLSRACGKLWKKRTRCGGLGGLLGKGLHRCAEVRVDISVSHTPNVQKKAEMRSGVAVMPSLSLLSNLFLIWAAYLFMPFKSWEFFFLISIFFQSMHTHTLRTAKALFSGKLINWKRSDTLSVHTDIKWCVSGEKIDDLRE